MSSEDDVVALEVQPKKENDDNIEPKDDATELMAPSGPAVAEHALESKPQEKGFDVEEDDPNRAPWDIFGLVARVKKSPIEDQLEERYKGLWCGKRLAIGFDHFFFITARQSSFLTEFYAGTTTFFSMAYIMALNPIIVASAIGFQYKAGLFFSTCFASGVFTMLMGALVNVPVALAPGMGLNAYFANIARVAANGTLIGILTWQQGMASVFLSGLIYLFLTITGLRFLLFKAVPIDLRHAMSAGIGLFICIIGYKIGWILGISYYGGPIANPTAMIPFYNYDIIQVHLVDSPEARITVLGLMWVALFLTLKVRSAILCAIVLTTFCGIVGDGMGADSVTPLSVWKQSPIPFIADTSNLLAGHMDFSAAKYAHFWDVTWTFLFVEMFDSFGTLCTVVMKSNIGKGNPKVVDRLVNNAMLVDGWGLLFGSIVGSNSITCFIESLTGIAAGGRTGFASIITGAYFLLALLFVYPFVAIIPDSATVPALFMVGVYSISSIKHIDWDDFPTAFSAFMMIATMPFTYSIANGIAAGFIFYNFCIIVRWISHRFAGYRCTRGFDFNMPPPSEKKVWEVGWHPSNDKDFIPHPIMIVVGIFMCLRYRYFF